MHAKIVRYQPNISFYLLSLDGEKEGRRSLSITNTITIANYLSPLPSPHSPLPTPVFPGEHSVKMPAMNARFIGESISVEWDKPPLYEKKPSCPARFTWGDETLEIVDLWKEWRDYERRGRRKNNMRPANLSRARKRGSWGVGRYYFRVQTADSRLFDIYYDRAPIGSDKRKGTWHLHQEII